MEKVKIGSNAERFQDNLTIRKFMLIFGFLLNQRQISWIRNTAELQLNRWKRKQRTKEKVEIDK